MPSNTWDTDDEIAFIKKLKPKNLVRYFDTLPLRAYWGKIDQGKLVQLFGKEIKNGREKERKTKDVLILR